MILSSEQRKLLKILSYQIKSYGGEEGTLTAYVYDGSIEFQDDLDIIGTPHQIEIDGILIELFKDMYYDELESEFGYDSSGSVDFNVDAKESTLEIVVHVNTRETNYTSDEFSFDDLRDMNDKFDEFVEKYKSYGSGTIKYEGSGDSGYIEEDMETPKGSVSLRNEDSFTDMLYNILNNYGGWEINEGSQGEFSIDFNDEIMTHEHGENYEETSSDTFATMKF